MNKTIVLSNGVSMPSIGAGTYPLKGNSLENMVFYAYDAGYRLFDTADNYYNEKDLGNSLVKLYSKTTRENLFLVTKVSDELYPIGSLGAGSNRGIYFWKNSPYMQENNAVKKIVTKKIENSLKELHTGYIDLLLMHWPYPDYFEEIWYEMELLYKEGKTRAIGVCNCEPRHFETLKKSSSILPMVNQLETSPINTKEKTIEYCKRHDIQIMVYSPLMNLRINTNPEYSCYLDCLSTKYNKTKAQIVLRFDIERGLIPIPKSSHKERIHSNIDIFDFSLSEDEVNKLLTFNEDKKYLPSSKSCPGL